MPKKANRPEPTIHKDLSPRRQNCPVCGQAMWMDYTNHRTLVTLDGCLRLNLAIRRCHQSTCQAYLRPYRPEHEGHFALPHHEFGLDVIALIGSLRYRDHCSVPEIHHHLLKRDVGISERSVTNLLDRYDELLATDLSDSQRLRHLLANQGQVILAIDGLQPDVGHEVLWVIRDCISGEILLAKSMLSARQVDLAELLTQVKDSLGVPIVGAISDGQHSIRKAIAQALPDVPHQLCQFHYLREAARPIYEADRHAKKLLKKKVRKIRAIERSVEGKADEQSQVILGYCSAVRSALTDDGRPPLEAPGLKLQNRLELIHESLERMGKDEQLPKPLKILKTVLNQGLMATVAMWPAIALAFGWVHRAAHLLNQEGIPSEIIKKQLGGLLGAMAKHQEKLGKLAGAVKHFRKVTRSYWAGLFHTYEGKDLPRTNNALEQLFGSYRHHERRVSGRKSASPGLVLRGSARIIAAIATREQPDRLKELREANQKDWSELRARLEERRKRRANRYQFRRDPQRYLRQLEEKLNQSRLPT